MLSNLSEIDFMSEHHKRFQAYEFEEEKQPTDESEKSCSESIRRRPKLFLCRVPNDLTENGVMSFCSQYGLVRSLFAPPTCQNIFFVTFSTLG